MGFFNVIKPSTKPKKKLTGLPSLEFLHLHQCKVCSLDKEKLHHGKMEATGAVNPIIYCLGEAPGKTEDLEGHQFAGPSGKLLRPLIPLEYRNKVRWNNTLRCKPPDNRNPTQLETECCRGFIVSDIEQTKPKILLTFGSVPLEWAIPGDQSGISNWRGRRLPVKIGSYSVWMYPTFHPAFLLRRRGRDNKISEDERALQFDLKRAFAEIESLPDPIVHDPKHAFDGIEIVTGRKEGDLEYALAYIEYLSALPYTGLDYETNCVRPYTDNSKILTIAMSAGEETLAFAYKHPQAGWNEKQLEQITKAFTKYLLSKSKKCVHNLSFEQEWSAYFFGDTTIRNDAWEDTMSQAFVLDERKGKRVGDKPACLSLEFLCIQYFGLSLKSISKNLNKAKLEQERLEDVLIYNGGDAKYHLLLFHAQQERLEQEVLVEPYRLKLSQVASCVAMQLKGVPVDPIKNQELLDKYAIIISDIETEIRACPEIPELEAKIKSPPFNPGSPAQCLTLINDVWRVGGDKQSADVDVLEKVDNPLAKLILAYRSAVKMRSTYCLPCSPLSEGGLVYSDGKLHPNFNTVFTVTGRLSSDDPNAQNWPKRDSDQKEVREQIAVP
jgi:uracil-DNA glycosylase family 4